MQQITKLISRWRLATLVAIIVTFMSPISVSALSVYVNGKKVDQRIVDEQIAQLKKSSPMVAQQLNNPQIMQQLLKSIGIQQAILEAGNKQKLDQTEAYKKRMEQAKAMVYAQIMQQKIANQPVTRAQEQTKYDQLVQMAAKQKQYNVVHILVYEQKLANEILQKLDKGANFADLAGQYSKDAGSKAKGGDLGWSDGMNYAPEIAAKLPTMKKGQYLLIPVVNRAGKNTYYDVVMLKDLKNGQTVPAFDKIAPQLKQQIIQEKSQKFFENFDVKVQ